MSNIYQLKSKGVTYDLTNTIISDTEPTGENRLPVWIKPNYSIRMQWFQDNIDSNTYFWQWANGDIERDLSDNVSNVILGGIIYGAYNTGTYTKEQVLGTFPIPAVGKQYKISFNLKSYGDPVTIPATAPIGLVYFDKNMNYLGDSISEIGTEYISTDNPLIEYTFDKLPSEAYKFLVVLPPQLTKSYLYEVLLNPTEGSTEFSYNILQSNGVYYPIATIF